MTGHLLRLVWNRKRQNLLLAFEIFLSFVALFVVVLFSLTYYVNWSKPLGFDISRVWAVGVRHDLAGPLDPDGATDAVRAARARAVERMQEIYRALDDLPNVEAIAGSWPSVPYSRGGWSTGFGEPTRAQSPADFATDEFAEVVGADVVAGRWFTREDDGASWTPAVINQRLARVLFDDDDPLGRELPPFGGRTSGGRPARVVGIISDFRQQGEPAIPGHYAFLRMRKDDPSGAVLPSQLVMRMAPGTTADFEPVLLAALQSVAPDWTFVVLPLDVERDTMLQSWLAPLMTVGVIVVFLLLMVALGLTGVVWQSVTRRTREFGLRRAKGASIAGVRRQVLAETALLTSLAVAVGVALVVQIPLLPLRQLEIPSPSPLVWLGAIATSVVVIYLLTLLCAWYPSRLATAIQPAEALHYE